MLYLIGPVSQSGERLNMSKNQVVWKSHANCHVFMQKYRMRSADAAVFLYMPNNLNTDCIINMGIFYFILIKLMCVRKEFQLLLLKMRIGRYGTIMRKFLRI